MKKLLTVLLALALLLGMGATALAATPADTLVVGTPSMNGDFIEGFGNSAYDAAIKGLLHGHMSTVATTIYAEFLINPTVVANCEITFDEVGNKTYAYTLNEGLVWSDGSPITAKDYVFSILYFTSPAWVKAGASNSGSGYGLVGYRGYLKGLTDTFAGVKLIDELTFSLTIDAEELPYFYEITYVAYGPTPMAVYAPDMAIVSDENGAKLIAPDADQAEVAAYREEAFPAFEAASAEINPKIAEMEEEMDETDDEDRYYELVDAVDELKKQLAELQPQDANFLALLANLERVAATERFAPTVVCGPYTFLSFENGAATLQRNANFNGTYDGKKPSIEYIVQKFIPQDTDYEQVISGDVDIVAGNIEGPKIEAVKASETAETHSYFRNGYGYLGMHCDWGVCADPNVRWALGYMIDRNEVIDYVLGGYGGVVHAEYGFAQWMYDQAGAELEELLTPFNLNIEKANEKLDLTEWKFEADGETAFDASKANADGTYMRHNAAGEPLVVKHLGTEDNSVTDIIEIQYAKNAPLAGVKFDVTKSDFQKLLTNFYYGFTLGDEREFNTFNLATNFGTTFDPYFASWHSDYVGSWENSCQLGDAELDEYIMAMRSLESSQKDEFVEIWLKYQVRWQELLPQIPLYSNEYFDFFGSGVKGMNTTPFATWDDIICDITKE